jgi:hypothetical protein
LLWIFDDFTFLYISFGVFSHVVYFQLLKGFPFIRIKSIAFILSCGMFFYLDLTFVVCFVLSHVFWYYHFTSYRTPAYDFYQLLGFFFCCVWIAPMALFITLSIGDMSLPGIGNMPGSHNTDILRSGSTSRQHQKKQNIFAWIMGVLSNITGKKQPQQPPVSNEHPNVQMGSNFRGDHYPQPPSQYPSFTKSL